jgi:sugar O-acyltransferase (sialic acid O-acetyltransferase NeuD family)
MNHHQSMSGAVALPHQRPLVVVGAGGHAVSVANVARSAGYVVACFVDPSKKGGFLLGRPIIACVDDLEDGVGQYVYSVAVGDNAARQRVHGELSARHRGLVFPPLVHASAVISDFVVLGEGAVLMPLAVVGPNSSVGRFCILNTRSSIDHDCVLSDFASLAPGAVTGGAVRIGSRSAISLGAAIKHGVSVGADCVVGACSYVNQDLPSNLVAYGTPSKVVRLRAEGDPYL